MPLTDAHIRRLTWVLLGITGVLVVISYGSVYAWRMTDLHDLHAYVFVGHETNLPTWWNTALLFCVGIASVVAAGATAGSERRAWWVVGAATVLISLDEASQVHEQLAYVAPDLGLPTFRWVVLGAVIAAVGTVFLVVVRRPIPGRTRRRLGLALGLYLLGALVFEAIGGYFYTNLQPFRAAPFTHIEEGLEMSACVLALAAILRRLVPLRIQPQGDREREATAPRR